MKENINYEITTSFNDEIDLRDLIKIFMNGKWIVVSLSIFFAFVGVLYSLSIANVYESKTLLAPNSYNNDSKVMGEYTNLANLAGIDYGSNSNSANNAKQAEEKLKSLSFFEDYFLPNIFLPDLMAVESWEPKINLINYNNETYDMQNKKWVRDFSYPQKQIPSSQESFEVFKKNHFSISVDKPTNFVIIKIKHQSPFIAQQWSKVLVEQINSYYRKKDKNEAEKASKYLNNLLIQTNFSEVKQLIASLLQEETQKLTLIEANEYYVYEYIDPPAAMENKSYPNRAFICIVISVIGFIASIIIVLLRHYLK